MTFQTKNIVAAELQEINWDQFESESFFRELLLKYSIGSQYVKQGQQAVTDIVRMIAEALAGTPITVSLWFGESGRSKKPIGIRIQTASGTDKILKLEVKSSLVTFAGRSQFLGSGHAVVALGHKIVEEVQRVVTTDAKFAARGTDNV